MAAGMYSGLGLTPSRTLRNLDCGGDGHGAYAVLCATPHKHCF